MFLKKITISKKTIFGLFVSFSIIVFVGIRYANLNDWRSGKKLDEALPKQSVIYQKKADYAPLPDKISEGIEDTLIDNDYESIQNDNILIYKDLRNNFTFTYPKRWGDVNVKDLTYRYTEEDYSNGWYDGIDLNKVLSVRYLLEFSEQNCKINRCYLYFEVREFSSDAPLSLDCIEGVCEAINLIDKRNNIHITGNTGLEKFIADCEDDFSDLNESFVRECTIFNQNAQIVWKMIYPVNISDPTIKKSLDKINYLVQDKVHFESILEEYNTVLNSIIF